MEQLASQDDTIRDVLRSSTAEAHDRLHLHSSFKALFDQSLSLSAYRQLICRLHGFYAPLDQAIKLTIAKQASTLADYHYVDRSDFLARDLMDLNFDKKDLTESRYCQRAFDLVSPASLGGVLYVVEGATLGGTGIDRYAQKLLGHQEPAGRRYWAWCRAQNKQRWSMALAYLDSLHNEGAALDDMVTGAHDTFQALADWLAPLDQTQFFADRGQM